MQTNASETEEGQQDNHRNLECKNTVRNDTKELKIKNWTSYIQDRKKWKLYVEKAKHSKNEVVAPKEEEEEEKEEEKKEEKEEKKKKKKKKKRKKKKNPLFRLNLSLLEAGVTSDRTSSLCV